MVTINNIVSGILNDYYKNASTAATTASTSASASSTSATDKSSKDYTGTLVGKYLSTATSDTASAKEIFQKLSVDVGGDGKSITKDQLDSFVKEAKSGKVSISDKELSSLTEMQDNWTEIADGGKNITYSGMVKAGFKDTLTDMVPEETAATTDYQKLFNDSTAAAYSKIVVAALNGTSNSSEKTSTLGSLLNTLLTGTTDENDDSNANLIATLTNLIANSKSTSTTEVEA